MNGMIGQSLRHLSAIGRHQRTGEIMPLVDDRRVGRMDDIGAHLVNHRNEGFTDQF